MTYFFAILMSLNNPEVPPAVLVEQFPTMQQCEAFKNLTDDDAEIKATVTKNNIKRMTFCTDMVQPIRGATEDNNNSAPTVSQS